MKKIFVVVSLFCVFYPAAAKAELRLELGAGIQQIGVFAWSGKEETWTSAERIKLQIEYLRPFASFWNDDLTLKGGGFINYGLAGPTSKMGGGGAFSAQYKNFEFVGNLGLGYFGDNLGENLNRGIVGQTKLNYELNAKFLYHPDKSWYSGVEFCHNSNGNQLGINFFGDKKNPGVDCGLFVLGYKF